MPVVSTEAKIFRGFKFICPLLHLLYAENLSNINISTHPTLYVIVLK